MPRHIRRTIEDEISCLIDLLDLMDDDPDMEEDDPDEQDNHDEEDDDDQGIEDVGHDPDPDLEWSLGCDGDFEMGDDNGVGDCEGLAEVMASAIDPASDYSQRLRAGRGEARAMARELIGRVRGRRLSDDDDPNIVTGPDGRRYLSGLAYAGVVR